MIIVKTILYLKIALRDYILALIKSLHFSIFGLYVKSILKYLCNKYLSPSRVFLPIRKLDDQGRMVIIIRAAVHDPNKHKFSDVVKVITKIKSILGI